MCERDRKSMTSYKLIRYTYTTPMSMFGENKVNVKAVTKAFV